MIRRALLWVAVVGCQGDRPQPALHAAAGSAALIDAAAPSECAVSILIDDAGLWIGTRAGTCRAPRVGGELDYAWGEAELRQIRHGLQACADADVASTTGAYRELIHVMDVAIQAGVVNVGL